MASSQPVVVVTGSSRGIGRATALELAARGVAVVGCARTVPPSAPGITDLAIDLADLDGPRKVLAIALERTGRVDGWINNAGVLDPIGPLAAQDPVHLRHAIDVNVAATASASACFAAHVAGRSGGGVLINVSSGAATSPYIGWAHYCAAKAFVDRLTEVLDLEGRRDGLRAFAVAPGEVDTEMQALIRATSSEDFPSQPRFVERFEAGALRNPAIVGAELADLVLGVVKPDEVVLRLGDGR